MATPVLMPRQGQSVETCILGQWYKNIGDKVSAGDLLFSYETDKASFEEEAKTDGILLATFFEEGDEVPVLVNVGVLGKKGESIGEFTNTGEQALGKKEVQEKEVSNEQEKPIIKEKSATTEKIKISPLAKKMAQAAKVDVATITGTGPNGRIIARDIEAPKSATKLEEQKPVAAKQIKPAVKVFETITGDDFEIKPLTNMRKLIAKAMHQSLQNSAQLTHHMSADVSKLLAFRERVKAAMKSRSLMVNISLNSMLCLCIIKALKKSPAVNSHLLGDTIKTFNKVHLGFAVDTKHGLMVPALKNADDLSIIEITQQIEELAKSAQKRNINPDLLSSEAASFSISNLEGYGVEMFTPVINLPQVAILGINAIQLKPIDTGKGNIEFIPHIGLSLTYDHRALDGGPATMFLRLVKQEIERFSQSII